MFYSPFTIRAGLCRGHYPIAFSMDQELERAHAREIRNLKDEIRFLRDLAWIQSNGPVIFQEKVEIIPFEQVGRTPVDNFVKTLLTET